MRELHRVIGSIERLNMLEMRALWAKRFGPAPTIKSIELFRLMLAWRIQEAAMGGLDAATERALRKSGSVIAETLDLGTGATIHRRWQGEYVVVSKVEGGFAWNGTTFRSLSAVANAITGSRWNGPKFFGMRP